MRTMWLTGLTLMALLLSSVPVGASLMSGQQSFSGQTVAFVAERGDTGCVAFHQDKMSAETGCCDAGSPISDHQCCPATCVAGSQIMSQAVSCSQQTSTLVLISRDAAEHTSSVASALYRPPII